MCLSLEITVVAGVWPGWVTGIAESAHGERRVLFPLTSGGHLAQALALEPWWRDLDRLWVTFDTPDALSLLDGERIVWAFRPTTRHIGNLIRNFWLAWKVTRHFRPDVVVSTGAGVAVPFFVVAKLLRIPTVYVEVYDRIDSRTLSGRLCRPFSDLFLVQWPEQLELYPRRHARGEVAVSDSTPPLPDPPFVFVTVGTDHHPFDRLVQWADEWTTRTGIACLVQTGTSISTSHATSADVPSLRNDDAGNVPSDGNRLPRRTRHDHGGPTLRSHSDRRPS